MKKAVFTLLAILFCGPAFSQIEDFQAALDSAKSLFYKGENLNREELDKFDYTPVLSLLEQLVELKPDNPEARYFLGYAIDRATSKDGRSMIDINLSATLASSEQFEKVNELSPLYEGEVIILSPYSKLTAEWGSLAMSYILNNKPDSAKWAFEEGKKRGGFGDFILAINKAILKACSDSAILISSGDNMTFPILYLQTVKGFRKDITVLDISLLNADWYPSWLAREHGLHFGLPKEALDTLQYDAWQDSTFVLGEIEWTVKPSYANKYLLRGDIIFLNLVINNALEKDVFLTMGFYEKQTLGISKHLSSLIVANKIDTKGESTLSHKEYMKSIATFFRLKKAMNTNCIEERRQLDNLRYDLFKRTDVLLLKDEKEEAAQLLELLDKHANETDYPYTNPKGQEFLDYLRSRL